MKKIFTSLLICFGLSGLAQNQPTLLGYEIDTICQSEIDFAIVHTIQIQDLDADSTYIVLTSWNGGHFYSITPVSPAFVPGQTIRTFSITADAGTGLLPGLNLSDIVFSAYGNITNDAGYTSGLTISNAAGYGYIATSLNLSSVSMCENDNPIDMRPYATPAGGTFTYVSETNYMFDPTVYLTGGGGSISYTYINPAGCSGYTSASAPVINTPPNIGLSPSYSTCGNADGSILSFISGSAPPYNLYWSTGFSESVSGAATDITNLYAGNYYVNVTDANGCHAVGLAQISDIEVDVSGSITDETCIYASEDGEINLTITPSLGSVNYIYWSNGQTTSTLSGVHKGEYQVEVRTDAGCEANQSYFVSANAYLYAQTFNNTDASCSNSDGVIDIEVYNGSGDYSYIWNTGATSQDLFGIPSGSYSCDILDNITGCITDYKYDVFSMGGPGASLNYITQPSCGGSDGAINLNVYQFSAPISSISWSSGQTTDDLENIPAGDYELTVTALDGCIFNHTIKLGTTAPEKPEICMLTVDSSLTYNVIIWEKDLSQPSIAGYNIYRETSQYGVFELVSQRPIALESIFQDNDASPVDRSWRYYITAYDVCGNESEGSYVHKTFHVVANTVNSIDYTVTWDNYEGFAYASVDVMRFDSTNGWMTVANVPYGTNNSPNTPPVLTGLDYMIQYNLASPCTSSKAQDHNSSRSNKTASVFSPGGSTVQVSDENLGVISIYPNPTSSDFTLHIDQPDLVQYFEITDLSGNLVHTGSVNTYNTVVSTEGMSAGIYLIKIYSDDKIITQKLVVN